MSQSKIDFDHSKTPTTRGGRWLSRLSILLIAIVCLSVLFFKADFVSEKEHSAYSQLLHDQRELEAKVNNEVLASAIALARNYDALVFFIHQLRMVEKQISKVPSFLAKNDSFYVVAQAKHVNSILHKKLLLIDRFKRINSLLHNSQQYFNELSHGLLNHHDLPLVNAYIHTMMLFIQTPEQENIKNSHLLEAQIRRIDFPIKTQKVINNLLLHGHLIEDSKLAMDKLLRQIMSFPFLQQQRKLIHLYSQGYNNALVLAEQYRILLYIMALILTLYLAYLFIDLEMTRRSLAKAHKEVSDRFQAQKRAETLLKLHDTAFNSAHEGITLTDAEANIITVNPAFTRITGYDSDDVVGKNPRILKSGHHDDRFYHAMWTSIAESGSWVGEIWNKNKLGDVYPELLSINSVTDNDNIITNYVAVFSDISHIKEQENQLKKMAYYDALTQLPNRLLLIDRITQAILSIQHHKTLMVVCYLDLDNFKVVNDTYGHELGDRLLVKMSERFSSTLRAGDTVARLGGDEFVFLLLGLDKFEEYADTLERLIKATAQVISVDGHLFNLTASVGVSVYPFDKSDAESLLRHADQAMYQAKQQGKNSYHLFDPHHDTLIRGRYHQISLIDQAFKAKEFAVYYQPKVDLRTGDVIGMEALIRWHHPEQGLLLPVHFLPVIEDHELIIKMDSWVIESVLAQMEIWQSQGLDLKISVNVTSAQLQQEDFVEQIKSALARHPLINPDNLELEVLETVALEDIMSVSKVIEECHRFGVSFALDDFGTGYSSLTYLKRLPISTLKIDSSFVMGMLSDPEDLAIVHSVLSLTNTFQKSVIAEGAETHEHCQMLLQLGCRYAQGFGIAKAMPAADVLSWVMQWQPLTSLKPYQELYWNDTDYPILAAEVEHIHWVNGIVSAVNKGEALSMVPESVANDHKCRFGKWYYGVGRQQYSDEVNFQTIEQLHQKIHILSGEIAQNCQIGEFEQAKKQLPQLLRQRDEIIILLRELSLTIAIKFKSKQR